MGPIGVSLRMFLSWMGGPGWRGVMESSKEPRAAGKTGLAQALSSA